MHRDAKSLLCLSDDVICEMLSFCEPADILSIGQVRELCLRS